MPSFNDSPPQKPDAHVSELPLFPLDVVLFPGMKMSLHIFEDRYKAMVERCLAGSRLFGVVLLRGDVSPKSPRKAKTHRVGCYARIAHAERLADGRFNLEIEGVERFRVLEQHEVEPYRTGIVEVMDDRAPMGGATEEVVRDLCGEVQTLLEEFLTRQLAALGQRIVEFDFPKNPTVLSLITACILPIDNPDKQSLLEGTDTAARLQSERDVLQRAIAQMKRGIGRQHKGESTDETFARSDTEGGAARFVPMEAERYREYVCVN